MTLTDEIRTIIEEGEFDPKTAAAFLERLKEGSLTRDENPTSHFCVYFAAFNSSARKIFIGHHKKSGLWLCNGGHIDKNESIQTTLLREMDEEWGTRFSPDKSPLWITITDIQSNPAGRPCKKHFDIWYNIGVGYRPEFDNEKLATEFHETRWLTIPEAESLVTDPATLSYLTVLDMLLHRI